MNLPHLNALVDTSSGTLSRYEALCCALAEAKSVDDIKEYLNEAEAIRAYARQAKNRQLEADAAEIRFRAERRIGELIAAQRDSGMLPEGRPKNGLNENPFSKPITLDEIGIDKNLADRARKSAAVSADEFEDRVNEWREHVIQGVGRVSVNLLDSKKVRGTQGTGENEWYTPDEYLDLARTVLGTIDLDPASSEQANSRVAATTFYSLEDDGLAQQWHGNIWLNPPYSQPSISHFADKMVSEWNSMRVESAIVLTHNYTDTAWFHVLAQSASAICFTKGRIRFVAPDGTRAAPTQGQAFFYYGSDYEGFTTIFSEVGFVVEVCR